MKLLSIVVASVVGAFAALAMLATWGLVTIMADAESDLYPDIWDEQDPS